MQKGVANSLLRIDLSNKSQTEIAEYLQAILAVRYAFQKKGLKLKIDRVKSCQLKIDSK